MSDDPLAVANGLVPGAACDSGAHSSTVSRGVNRPPRIELRVAHKPASYPVGRTGPKRGENRCDSWLSRGENRQNY